MPPETPREHATDEQSFLEEETRRTMHAIDSEARALAADLRACTSVSAWTREYPWLLVGSSAAAGLGAGVGLGIAFRRKPSKASRRDRTRRAPPRPRKDEEKTKAAAADPKKSSWLLRAGVQLASFLAKRALTAYSRSAPPTPADEPPAPEAEALTGAGAAT